MQFPQSKKVVTFAGVAGATAILAAGGSTLIAAAADTYQDTASSCSGVRVPAPGAPVFERTLLVAPNGTSSGTIPAASAAATAAGVTAKALRFEIRTQYDSPGSTAKSAVMDVTVTNHAVYHNPVLFAIPPVDNSFAITPDEVISYNLRTRGKVASKVTIREFVTEATGSVTKLGRTCPTGTTRDGYLQGNPTPSATTTAP